MRFRLLFLVSLLLLLVHTGAAAAAQPIADRAGARLLALVTDGSDDKALPQITALRWAAKVDAVSGDPGIRLVLDVSGPVQASAFTLASPVPRLVIDVTGAVPGSVPRVAALDGNVADKVRLGVFKPGVTRVVMDLPAPVDEDGYNVFTLPADKANGKPFRVVADISRPAPPVTYHFTPGLAGKRIVLDPGHGGTDPGAIGPGGTQEKDVTLPIALAVRDLLVKAGAKVWLTRDTDRDVYAPNDSAVEELGARVAVANANQADVFISIHANASTDASATGTGTYYYRKSGYDGMLADYIQRSVVAATGLADRGTVAANLYVTKRTRMPAVLVETAFISNPREEKLLATPAFQQRLAAGIVNGLDQFFSAAAGQGGNT